MLFLIFGFNLNILLYFEPRIYVSIILLRESKMVEDIQVRQQIFQIMIARKIGDNKILLIKHILLMNY